MNFRGLLNMFLNAKIVYNKLLGGWYIVRGKHQTPISGRFESKEAAMNWVLSRRTA